MPWDLTLCPCKRWENSNEEFNTNTNSTANVLFIPELITDLFDWWFSLTYLFASLSSSNVVLAFYRSACATRLLLPVTLYLLCCRWIWSSLVVHLINEFDSDSNEHLTGIFSSLFQAREYADKIERPHHMRPVVRLRDPYSGNVIIRDLPYEHDQRIPSWHWFSLLLAPFSPRYALLCPNDPSTRSSLAISAYLPARRLYVWSSTGVCPNGSLSLSRFFSRCKFDLKKKKTIRVLSISRENCCRPSKTCDDGSIENHSKCCHVSSSNEKRTFALFSWRCEFSFVASLSLSSSIKRNPNEWII